MDREQAQSYYNYYYQFILPSITDGNGLNDNLGIVGHKQNLHFICSSLSDTRSLGSHSLRACCTCSCVALSGCLDPKEKAPTQTHKLVQLRLCTRSTNTNYTLKQSSNTNYKVCDTKCSNNDS